MKAICINNGNIKGSISNYWDILTVGKEYEITKIEGGTYYFISDKGNSNCALMERFQLVANPDDYELTY